MHVFAEASGQALSPQDQVALVTKAIQQDVVLLVLGISTVVYEGHDVSLQQTEAVGRDTRLKTCGLWEPPLPRTPSLGTGLRARACNRLLEQLHQHTQPGRPAQFVCKQGRASSFEKE